MSQVQSKLFYNRNVHDDERLEKQLKREIVCLERQVSRLQLLSPRLDDKTLSTYQEMIATRRAMLEELSH